ncbi:MAG: MFS transporter [Candidatus Dormibacteraeota bacterium]|nr:MFS transporter [Candidatus Dormibacteraeota bacterium]
MTHQRRAVSVAFLVFGAVSGSWVPRLPAIKDHHHISDGQVGYALVLFAVGAVLGAALARLALGRGARGWVRAGTVAICVALLGPGLAGSLAELLAAVLLLGACAGFIDVLENAQASELERKAGRPLINGFHGFWSLGAIMGSVVAGGAALAGVSPLPQFALAAILSAVASAPFLRDLPDTRSGADRVTPTGAGRLWLTRSVVAVGAIAFCGILVEGGTGDWSAIYLREFSHANPGIAAGGFAAFALAATVVRFRADQLTARTSPGTVARLGGLIAAFGLALAIAVPALPVAVIGFALVGVGTAVLVPLAFSAGANLGASGTSLTVVLAAGYAGSIAGPAMIGYAADHVGLRVALGILLAGAVVVIALAGTLHAKDASEAQSRGVISPPSRR